METLTPILMFANALVGLVLIILILLQRSDPAAGGMFGGGAGNSVVVRNPLAKPTAMLAAIFLLNCVVIAYTTNHHGGGSDSVMAEVTEVETVDIGAAPVAVSETVAVDGGTTAAVSMTEPVSDTVK